MINKTNTKFLVGILSVIILAFAAHTGLLYVANLQSEWDQFNYSLIGIYSFELIFTALFFFALIGIYRVMPANFGFVFLGLITLRAVASYIFINKGLEIEGASSFLKYNFLVGFMLFLALDAVIAYAILNKKIG